MKKPIKVPQMGESVTPATIVKILQEDGANVKAEQEILELETEKANQLLYAPISGKLHLDVSVDDKIPFGKTIGYVENDQPEEEEEEDNNNDKSKEEKTGKGEGKEKAPEKQQPSRKEPSDKGARVSKENYLQALISQKEKQPTAKQEATPSPSREEEKKKQKPRETRQKMSNLRKVIASRLLDVQQQTAMVTTFNEIDMSTVVDLRAKYQQSFQKAYNTKLGLMAFFVKAVTSALHSWPLLNAYIDNEEIVQRHYYDIGVAVGTEKGLFVPVLKGCDKLSFSAIEQTIDQYAKKAKEGNLAVEDLQGGGFTITNGGIYGSLLSTPIINPPQSAILGMHKIVKKPVVVDDQIVIRPMMFLALTYDHRLVDGREAVSFLTHIKECLEDPAQLLLGLPS
ncbi:MAG: 2-oxoglutarate dehydrogenase complex dihydrolipoyllysine-residue succinyltransferase [Chlamydiota bacterium]